MTVAHAGLVAPGGMGAEHHWEPDQRVELGGLILTDWRAKAGSRVGRTPTAARLQLVMAGQWCAAVGGEQLQWGPGVVVWYPADAPSPPAPGPDAALFEVSWNEEWGGRLAGPGQLSGSIQVSRSPAVAAALLRLRGEFTRLDRWTGLLAEGIILEAVAGLGRDRAPASRRTGPPWMDRLLRMLEDDTVPTIPLSAMARLLGVDRSALSRQFRHHHGCPPSEYLRRQRVAGVARALAGSTESLGVIAARHGFADQSHLTRVFRRHTGLTPAAYRRHFITSNNLREQS